MAAVAGTALLVSVAGVRAQPSKLIEVASVKPSHNTLADSNLDSVRGRLTATNITVRELIRLAYGVRDYQVERAPKWVDSERFDVTARCTSNVPTTWKTKNRWCVNYLPTAFNSQLIRRRSRCRYSCWWLPRTEPRLTPHSDTVARTRGGCGRLVGRRVTADAVAAMLSKQVEHEVFNRTGLAGEYDFQLDFTPDSGPCRAAVDDPAGKPSVYTAVQEQLGLKLEPSKGPVQLLVIDRVEKPSGN